MQATERIAVPAAALPRAASRKLLQLADLFAWPLRASHYVELLNPLWSSHSLTALVETVTDETPEARTLTLLPGRGWRPHRAGQHLRVGLFAFGKRFVRTYSISSAPERSDGRITITVKIQPSGRVSPHLVRSIGRGAYLEIGLPEGDFVLPQGAPIRPLFITGGSGITPVMSMLRSLAAHSEMRDVVHVHHAPRREDVIFGAELSRLAADHPGYRLHVIETRSSGDSRHLTLEGLRALCPDLAERETFSCGPQGLLKASEQIWRNMGRPGRLHVERFRASQADMPPDAAGGLVRFARSGVDEIADGTASLLCVAEDAGLNPAHGCRMGICHSCDVTLLSGCVRDLRNNRRIDEPGTRVQLCVSAAAGPAELDL